MSTQPKPPRPARRPSPGRPRDLLSLMSAPLSDVLDELAAAADGTHDEPGVPARALQLADMLVAGVVRLIRLGTRSQLSRAAEDIAHAILDPSAEQLAHSAPAAHELLISSASVLAAAVAPSSGGGEIAVLRSWRGKALAALRLVAQEPEQGITRKELQVAMGQLDDSERSDSHLSHVFTDLEAAGLIERIKTGREVIVYLGPTAHTEHVRRIIRQVDEEAQGAVERTIRSVLEAAIADGSWELDLVGPEAGLQLIELHNCVMRFRHEVASADVSIREVVGSEPEAIVRVRVTGRVLDGGAALAVIDEELLWSVRLRSGRIVNVKRWVQTLDWLGRPPIKAAPREQPVWPVTSADDRVMVVDAAGEFRNTARALAWLPGGSRQITKLLTVDLAITNAEKSMPPYRGQEPSPFPDPPDREVATDDQQSLR